MSTVAPLPRERLVALDVFRGITVAGMLLVNDPGSWSAIYEPLEHAPWHGWTPTDLVFPFFLFIVGVTTYLSKKEPKRILRRGGLIILIGLLINAFPFFWWGKIANTPDPTFMQRVAYRFAHLRFLGVLQRIGIVYICAALISLRATRRALIATIVAILVGYWLVMTLVPVPGTGGVMGFATLDTPDQTLAAWSDRAILGKNHIWSSSKTWDPEGPMSTIPAIATCLLGILAAAWIVDRKRTLIERVAGLYGAGCLTMLAGNLWSWWFPINKNLWTSSYVVFCAGFACVVLATCIWMIDVNGWRRWAAPFIAFGVNPLVAFAGSGLMARTTDSLWKVQYGGKPTTVHQLSYEILFEPYFPAKFASLLWGLCFVGFWFVILWLLRRRNIVLKV